MAVITEPSVSIPGHPDLAAIWPKLMYGEKEIKEDSQGLYGCLPSLYEVWVVTWNLLYSVVVVGGVWSDKVN